MKQKSMLLCALTSLAVSTFVERIQLIPSAQEFLKYTNDFESHLSLSGEEQELAVQTGSYPCII